MGTSNLYSEWRDFYAKRIISWMSLEELRAECGKLQTADKTSPELLLIHAMHALEELQAEIERLREALAAMVDIDPEALMKVFKWTKVILVNGNNNAT